MPVPASLPAILLPILALLLLVLPATGWGASTPTISAVPTFSCIGLTWSGVPAPASPALDADCRLEYRVAGSATWRTGLPLWYDARDGEYRGSVVDLASGTRHEIRLTLQDGTVGTTSASTWSDSPPIARTVLLPASSDVPLTISESGSDAGYVLYTAAPGKQAVIDVAKRHDFDVIVNASHVIVRGLTLRGAKHSGILLGPNASDNSADVSDVIIEGNDISAWGTDAANDPAKVLKYHNPALYGINTQAAVYSRSIRLRRVAIQRNRMHHPSTDANSWKEYNCSPGQGWHPAGPQAISIFGSQGNLVVRYNEIWSDPDHYFNDSMGEFANFSDGGFPNRDSDIHGNLIRNCWDDGIESEGANRNVRIWGNYIDQTYIKIAIAATHRGPLYIWRNVAGASRTSPDHAYGQGFIKTRNWNGEAGRVYLFNNSAIRPSSGSGVSGFIKEYDEPNRLIQFRTLNNFIHLQDPAATAISEVYGTTNRFDHDFLVGRSRFNAGRAQEVHAITGTPVLGPGWGFDETTRTGTFALAGTSPGHRQGVAIPNFAEAPAGAAGPDVGAHQLGTPAMQFGVRAHLPTGAVNAAPAVDAGPARTVTLPARAGLDGTASDDGLPGPGLGAAWTTVSGPGTVTFASPSAVDTSAAFSVAGSYVVRLTVSDGSLSASDTVAISVLAPAPGTYAVEVEGGSGDGAYAAGTVVPIAADAPPAGRTFLRWDVSGTAAIADATDPTTTITVGGQAAKATATWTTAGGGGSGPTSSAGKSGGGCGSGSLVTVLLALVALVTAGSRQRSTWPKRS